jgi:hypothetical protein
VAGIHYLADGKPRLATSGQGYREEAFELVILAVGFGLERPLSPVPFLSYWENDIPAAA